MPVLVLATAQPRLSSMPPKIKKAARPIREAAAKAMWASTDPATWQAALDAAPSRAAATGVVGEAAFYSLNLATRTSAGQQHPISALQKADVVTTVAWKLSRGTWRPRLLAFAEALQEGEVESAAAAAAAALKGAKAGGAPGKPAVQAAIAALSELKGIGPATATALLTVADPSIPFLSDEAAVGSGGEREYTIPAALRLTAALRERASALGPPWTARDIERALWSASRGPECEGEGEVEASGGGSKKRKKL